METNQEFEMAPRNQQAGGYAGATYSDGKAGIEVAMRDAAIRLKEQCRLSADCEDIIHAAIRWADQFDPYSTQASAVNFAKSLGVDAGMAGANMDAALSLLCSTENASTELRRDAHCKAVVFYDCESQPVGDATVDAAVENAQFNKSILVTTDEDNVMVFCRTLTPEALQFELDAKSFDYVEVYEVPEKDIQFYCYDPLWLKASAEQRIIDSYAAHKAEEVPAEGEDGVRV